MWWFMDKLTRAAVSDALHFLSGLELRSVLRSDILSGTGADFNLCSYPVNVARITLATRKASDVPLPCADVLDRVLSALADGGAERFFVEDANLYLLHSLPGKAEAYLVTLTPAALAHFLAVCFPGKRITRAQQRLLMLLLTGMTLIDSAGCDDRSIQTQKSHARDLRAHFEVATTHDVTRIIGAQLVAAVAAMLGDTDAARHEMFFDYARRFLPACTRAVILAGPDGQSCRVYDLGPQDGQPVIALHPLILPDLRAADVDLLHHLQLRLIWPLRPGQLAPHDPVIAEAAQIAQSNAALDLVQQTYGRGAMTLLAFAASSKLALAYAHHAPGAVARIFFAAACELRGRPQDGPRRLARGLIALGGVNAALQQSVMSFFARKVLRSRNFPDFLRMQFAGSQADLAMVEHELGPAWRGERMRAALVSSLRSMRHDFGFQRDLGWDSAADCGAALHFIHGADDHIHPLPLIRDLADSLGARLHVLPEAGQLIYGPHLGPVLAQMVACSNTGNWRR